MEVRILARRRPRLVRGTLGLCLAIAFVSGGSLAVSLLREGAPHFEVALIPVGVFGIVLTGTSGLVLMVLLKIAAGRDWLRRGGRPGPFTQA